MNLSWKTIQHAYLLVSTGSGESAGLYDCGGDDIPSSDAPWYSPGHPTRLHATD